ncbi:MAG: OmpH family outer membrane protein [Xanthomarina sp.]
MKNIILVALAIVTLVSCDSSLKTGFVDNGELINKYQEKIDIEEKFNIKVETFHKRRDSIGGSLQLEYQTLQEKAKKMTEDQVQQEYQVFSQKQQMLQQRIQMEEQEIQQQSQVQIDSLISKVKKSVKEYGEKNGYTYIFGSNDAGSVMYGKESNDLTQRILEALNNDYNK